MSALVRIRTIAIVAATLLCVGLAAPVHAAVTPGVATGLRAAPTSSSVTLSWKAPSNAKSYGICLYTSAAATSCTQWHGGITGTSLIIRNLKPTGGRDYFFTVLSYNGSAFSRTARLGFDLGGPVATMASPIPAVTTGLKAATTRTGATLTWSAARGADHYGVCLYTSASTTACHRWYGNLRGTSLTLSGLVPSSGTDYHFTVLAYNASGFSRSVKVGFNLVTATIPAKPTGLVAAPNTSGATLSWSPASGADHYGVCLYTSAAATTCYRWYGNLRGTSLTVSGLVPTGGTDYFFTVLAYNPQGLSRSSRVGFDLGTPGPIKPAAVTGMKHVVGTSEVTITWPAATNAEAYAVCLLTNSTTTTCARTTPRSSARTATFTNLGVTPDTDWYYIVRSYRGDQMSSSARIPFNLPVSNVTGFSMQKMSNSALEFTWNRVTNAEEYQLQLATDAAMTRGVSNLAPKTSPYPVKVTPGTTYYYRIRAVNGLVLGTFTTVQSIHLSTDPIRIDVLTFNLCGQDKCRSGASSAFRSVVPAWSTRKPIAGALVRSTKSDIIATQESGDKDTNFITQLPGFARAEYLSAKSLYYRTARYSKLDSGTITLSSARNRYAVWAEFQDKTTRTRFIVADAHLQPGKGKTNDDYRTAETKVLLSAIRKNNPDSLPVVYAGDFNSNKSNAQQSRYPGGYDAPYETMAAAGVVDARDTAAYAWHVAFNSANQGKNPPYTYGDHVDHVFVTPDITVAEWGVVTRLNSNGNYTTPFASDHNPVRSIMTIPGNS